MEQIGLVLDIRVQFTVLLSLCTHAFEFVCELNTTHGEGQGVTPELQMLKQIRIK